MSPLNMYTLLNVVGEGSFGRVYKAKHRQLGAIVALKLIRKIGRTERELENLRRECEILQELRHPNIILLTGSFETPSEVVVVMEFAEGELFDTIGTGDQLNRQKVLQVTCDLLSALYYLHSHRILHRDIKPQNILLGSDGRVKLCDFGFARVMCPNTYLLTSIKGTPLYMAPEIIQEKPYDHSADLWSLGCILYELVTGTPLFSTSSIIELVKKVTTEPIRFPPCERLYPECESFLDGLLQKDPRQRLTWPEILKHGFVRDKLDLHLNESATGPLTCPLSESQERRREEQRMDLEAKACGQAQFLVRAVHQMELDKQRKLREALIVMEAARRHRVCPSPPTAALKKYFKTGLQQPVQPNMEMETQRNKAQDATFDQAAQEDEDDIEDVPISTRARRRETMISDIQNFEDGIRQFAGTMTQITGVEKGDDPKLPTLTQDHEEEDDDKTVCNEDSLKEEKPAVKLPFPFEETNPVHRGEWERFLKKTGSELKETSKSCVFDVSLIPALLVPLRSSEIDPYVVTRIMKLMFFALVRASRDAEERKKLQKSLIECGAVASVLSCVARLTAGLNSSSSSDSPTDDQATAVGVLFDFLAATFSADEGGSPGAVAQFCVTRKFCSGGPLDVFVSWKKCLNWGHLAPKSVAAGLHVLCRLWESRKAVGPDVRAEIVDVFYSLKGRLFDLVETVSREGTKGEVDAAVQGLTLLLLTTEDGVLPDAKNDDDLKEKLGVLLQAADGEAILSALGKGASMLQGFLKAVPNCV